MIKFLKTLKLYAHYDRITIDAIKIVLYLIKCLIDVTFRVKALFIKKGL